MKTLELVNGKDFDVLTIVSAWRSGPAICLGCFRFQNHNKIDFADKRWQELLTRATALMSPLKAWNNLCFVSTRLSTLLTSSCLCQLSAPLQPTPIKKPITKRLLIISFVWREWKHSPWTVIESSAAKEASAVIEWSAAIKNTRKLSHPKARTVMSSSSPNVRW